jgi:hypothetical protein
MLLLVYYAISLLQATDNGVIMTIKQTLRGAAPENLNDYSNIAGNRSKLEAPWKLGAQKTKKHFYIFYLIGL